MIEALLSLKSYDLCRKADFHNPTSQTNCFYIPNAKAEPLMFGSKVVGDILQGNSVNCELISLCPHGSCTHTECIGHITPEKQHVLPPPPLMYAILIHADPIAMGDSTDTYPCNHGDDDKVISSEVLMSGLDGHWEKAKELGLTIDAVIIRTMIGSTSKILNFSGTNPPYVTPGAMQYLVDHQIRHVLVDLPSVDREDDQGLLAAHSIFFGLPPRERPENGGAAVAFSASEADPARKGCTITELCYIDEKVPSGFFALNLQLSPFLLDGIPSRPVIFLLNPPK